MPQTAPPTTIDEYLAPLKPEYRMALENLRRTIRSAAPKATECITYRMPAFRYEGMLVGFAAFPKHLGFYLMSTGVMDEFAGELAGYKKGKGSVQFTPDKPLAPALVKKLVKARMAENEALRSSSKKKAK